MILVTGAGGFLGSRLAAALRAQGHPVTATGRGEPPAGHPPGIPWVRADLADPGGAEAVAAAGPFTAVAHLAGKSSFKDTSSENAEMLRANVDGTFRALEIARAFKARFLFASSGMVYGDQKGPFREDMPVQPGNFYALTKVMGEEMARAYARSHGLAHMILRIAIVYGPGQPEGMFLPSLAAALAAGRDFPMTGGNQVRDFLHADDCARALALAATSNSQGTYNLASGVRSTLREAAELAQSLPGASGKVKAGALPYRQNELWEYWMDVKAIGAALGWRPEVGLRAGLEGMLRHAAKRT